MMNFHDYIEIFHYKQNSFFYLLYEYVELSIYSLTNLCVQKISCHIKCQFHDNL